MSVLIYKFPHKKTPHGGDRHTVQLVKELQQRGVSFYCASNCPYLLEAFYRREWDPQRIWGFKEPVTFWDSLFFTLLLPFIFIRLSLNLIKYRVFKKVRTLYCITLTEKITITPVARLLGMKVIWIEHNLIANQLKGNPFKAIYKLYSHLVTIVAVSKRVKKDLIESLKIHGKHVKLIPYGVDSAHMQSQLSIFDNLADQNYKDALKKSFVIGVIGRLHEEKGVETLIQALKLVKDLIPNIQLIIVGNGPERKNLQWLANTQGLREYIRFVGWQGEVQRWYKYFDIFIQPSTREEPTSITLLEAMACQKPVITNKIGCYPEIVDEERSAGMLIEPRNSEILAQAIIAMHRNPHHMIQYAENGRRIVEEKFQLQNMVSAFEEIL